MPSWTPLEEQAARLLVNLALEEDLGSRGDITTETLIPAEKTGTASFVARRPGVVCGEKIAEMVLTQLDNQAQFRWQVSDGAAVIAGLAFGQVHARLRAILSAERTMLNFLQRLSGIATLTHQFVSAVRGLPCIILDTRKTTPAWRILEKYAVRCGGGHNHRLGLFDGILIKDNHLAALQELGKDLTYAVAQVRRHFGSQYPIEVEAENLDQVRQALHSGADIILLDNMPVEQIRHAVQLRNQIAPTVLLEASGGISLENVRTIAETGVDRISIGALTHSAPALDLALDYQGQTSH
ncbi:MAG: carboxylating nicotinate-nucleotide diphosphorylase [Gemmatales bacterium]|nr:carboxylating nicotinate-nucleotide diphosphorylase [Gemmatales bacterium]MDW7995204.1 carboxylating nicotinate-nucleotide diphosphorylase [Gemmatales bacterium]